MVSLQSWISAVLYCLLTTHDFSQAQNNAAEIEKNCQKETKIPASDIENYKNMRLPQTTEGKCYGACVMKAVQMMSSDGKMDARKAQELAENYIKDESKLEKAEAMVRQCSQRANHERDACETAYSFTKCLMEVSSSHQKSGRSNQGQVTVSINPEISLSPPPLTLVLFSFSVI